MATTEEIKALRDATGVSIMQCKKALEEAGGDMEKAKIILRKQSAVSASKKADRELGAGIADAYIHAGGQVVAAVVLLCETDFVAKNAEFVALAHGIAMHVAAMNPQWTSKDEVTDEELAAARSVFAEEIKDVPDAAKNKALDGKLTSFVAERSLLEQPFIKDPSVTVRQLIEQGIQKFGEKIAVGRFERLSVR